MKTYETITETREFSIIKNKICDKCKKEIESFQLNNDKEKYFKCVELRMYAGYGSQHDFFDTGDERVYDICDDCWSAYSKDFVK